GMILFDAGDRERNVRVARDLKVKNSAGKNDPDGLRSKQLKAGLRVTLSIGRTDDGPLIRAIQLSKAAAPKETAPGDKPVQQDNDVNPQVVLVNGAKGGRSAEMIQDLTKGQGVDYWASVDDRLKEAGVTRAQVQVVWIKETNPAPHQGGFPKYIEKLQGELTK